MSKKILAILLITIFIVSVGTYIYYERLQSDKIITESVDDFELLFRYGVGAKNELNTFNGTYTKDMVIDPSIIIDLTLTVEEKWQIMNKTYTIDFFNLPSSFPINPHMWKTPQTDYYLKVQNGTETKEVSWNENSILEDSIEKNLDQLISYLFEIIENKAAYKALQIPKAGYI
ncbi:MAG: hypothetical protein FK734_18920 [Asgard group archaeon]|nr:hypothetical protein [Asgard group archaeon]